MLKVIEPAKEMTSAVLLKHSDCRLINIKHKHFSPAFCHVKTAQKQTENSVFGTGVTFTGHLLIHKIDVICVCAKKCKRQVKIGRAHV